MPSRDASVLGLLRRLGNVVDDESDTTLLGRFVRSRDEAAFAALVRRHGPMVLGVCRRTLGDPHAADDAFQTTFLALARKAGALARPGGLAGWLHGVARRVSLKARTAAVRRSQPPQDDTRLPDPHRDPLAELTGRELLAILEEEVQRLPAAYRLPVALCYLEGLSQEETARRLGVTVGSIRGRLERGRARLRARLADRGLAPAAVLAVAGFARASWAGSVSAGLAERVTREAVRVVLDATPLTTVKVAVAVLLGVLIVTTAPGLPSSQEPAKQPAAPAQAEGNRDPAEAPRPVRSLEGHINRLNSVAYSPDGTSIATASWDGTARIWDARTGQEVRRLGLDESKGERLQAGEPGSNTFHQIAFSPDNAFIVTAKRETRDEFVVIVWNRTTLKQVCRMPGYHFAISPDGKHIACGQMGVSPCLVRLYELPGGNFVREMSGPYSRADRLTFSPDGRTLFVVVGIPRPRPRDGVSRLGRDGTQVRVWDVATGRERPGGLEGVWHEHHLTVSPDGRTITVRGSAAKSISLRETATGGPRTELTGHTSDITDVAFTPDGRTVASASMDGTVCLWDTHSGTRLARLGKEVAPGQGGWVLSVAFSPDGRMLVSGGLDKTAHVWDVSRVTGRPRVSAERSAAELEADWKDLGGNATAGYGALGRLVASPVNAVPFLGKRLQAAAVDTRPIERLIAALDDDQFRVREQATKELEAMGDRAVASFRKALADNPSLEVRQRLDALLARVERVGPSAETLREVRTVEVLEAVGTPEARRLLDTLAAGPSGMRLTQEAKASADRLTKRTAVRP